MHTIWIVDLWVEIQRITENTIHVWKAKTELEYDGWNYSTMMHLNKLKLKCIKVHHTWNKHYFPKIKASLKQIHSPWYQSFTTKLKLKLVRSADKSFDQLTCCGPIFQPPCDLILVNMKFLNSFCSIIWKKLAKLVEKYVGNSNLLSPFFGGNQQVGCILFSWSNNGI